MSMKEIPSESRDVIKIGSVLAKDRGFKTPPITRLNF